MCGVPSRPACDDFHRLGNRYQMLADDFDGGRVAPRYGHAHVRVRLANDEADRSSPPGTVSSVAYRVAKRGSSASRTRSPNWPTASTTRLSASPGIVEIHQAVFK